tara:strand:+ start:339 stop:497 length:159 start_codon:yes stop_codon:yes gene_type:complete
MSDTVLKNKLARKISAMKKKVEILEAVLSEGDFDHLSTEDEDLILLILAMAE